MREDKRLGAEGSEPREMPRHVHPSATGWIANKRQGGDTEEHQLVHGRTLLANHKHVEHSSQILQQRMQNHQL